MANAFNDELSAAGFTKKGFTWYLRRDDVIASLNLQKSNYDATYFINLGFWIRAIEDVESPRPELCHVRTRADALGQFDSEGNAVLLTFADTPDGVSSKLANVQKFLREDVIPFLVQGITLAGLTAHVQKYKGLMVRRVAWDLLGVAEL
ncbi:MAG: DUF4304 domain-containing protein [Planctomycetales bacterium]|nr:DUF4304 domain-containing protein [Planctomycetales bacterium]